MPPLGIDNQWEEAPAGEEDEVTGVVEEEVAEMVVEEDEVEEEEALAPLIKRREILL